MRTRLVAAAIAGIVLGAVAMLALQSTPAPLRDLPRALLESLPSAGDDLLLAWTPDVLPHQVPERLRSMEDVRRVTVVRVADLRLTASFDAEGRQVDQTSPGFAIPLDAIVVDDAFAAMQPGAARQTLEQLRPGQAVLGATSARIRRLGAGGVLEIEGGTRLTITGIVDDSAIGAAEIATVAGAFDAQPRYVLIAHDGSRRAIEDAVREAAGVPVRFRTAGETPFLRHGDAVLPQVLVKERFGEFAFRDAAGRSVEIDPAWVRDNITTQHVAVLGNVKCHRAFLPAMAGAFRELEEHNLGFLVDKANYAGCWNARRIAEGEPLSRHAWGIAFDVNFGKNPTGLASAQDRRLVEVMERWGFTWGGRWLVPDPAHFEYLRPARR